VNRFLIVAALGLYAAACTGCGDDASALRRAPTARLTGRVLLAEGAVLPAYAPLDLVRAPLHPSPGVPIPTECASANDASRRPVTLAPDRGLSGIVVAAADFTRLSERRPTTHAVAIEGCRLTPPTIAAMGGDTLRVENRDAFTFAPMFGPAFRPAPLRRGDPIEVKLGAGSVESILCPPSAPCGRTDVVTFHHPVFAVSDARGAFHIDRFPAGEMVRVSAWHPLFELEETFAWVDAGKASRVDLWLRPKPRFVTP
jgi:hypothetical protein